MSDLAPLIVKFPEAVDAFDRMDNGEDAGEFRIVVDLMEVDDLALALIAESASRGDGVTWTYGADQDVFVFTWSKP